MKIYRGPETKQWWDKSHEHVSTVPSEELEASVKDGSTIRFNISKDAYERKAVCTIYFESEDIVPVITGLLSRLKSQQAVLLEIKALMKNQELSHDDKLKRIGKLIKLLQLSSCSLVGRNNQRALHQR